RRDGDAGALQAGQGRLHPFRFGVSQLSGCRGFSRRAEGSRADAASAQAALRLCVVSGMTAYNDRDRECMLRALHLAARGLFTTTPNPRVGCVIARDGRVIGEGWHERAGEPHAETIALAAARAS